MNREAFYVTVKDGPKTGFLLGPYETHEEALANVDRGREAAFESDNKGRSWFYAYGTSKITLPATMTEFPKGVFGQ